MIQTIQQMIIETSDNHWKVDFPNMKTLSVYHVDACRMANVIPNLQYGMYLHILLLCSNVFSPVLVVVNNIYNMPTQFS